MLVALSSKYELKCVELKNIFEIFCYFLATVQLYYNCTGAKKISKKVNLGFWSWIFFGN